MAGVLVCVFRSGCRPSVSGAEVERRGCEGEGGDKALCRCKGRVCGNHHCIRQTLQLSELGIILTAPTISLSLAGTGRCE